MNTCYCFWKHHGSHGDESDKIGHLSFFFSDDTFREESGRDSKNSVYFEQQGADYLKIYYTVFLFTVDSQ